ncbi:hypothetical protein [Agromyces soli]|uniref:Uncharacterized protein n=1 Tax=Agromyces soli TaxID=659012 RepID=A0ABY4AS01_9MICO|nr:hypothetical protein [Agromyces soli]UOE25937.1 hypothetical protein MTP13_16745 [Agromyces soli]
MERPDPEALRRALHADAEGADGARLDLEGVLSRSRRDRRRRRTAILSGAASAVAVLAIGGVVLSGGLVMNAGSTTADAPASASTEADGDAAGSPAPSATGVAPADEPPQEELALRPIDRLNPCGTSPAAANTPSADGLAIEISAVPALDAGGIAQATVTLTNTGEVPFRGELFAGPALTVADEVTRWHTSGLEAVRMPLALEPGEHIELTAPVRAVRCDDDAALTDPGALPALAPGSYALSAAVSLAAPGAALGVPLVSEPVQLTVR